MVAAPARDLGWAEGKEKEATTKERGRGAGSREAPQAETGGTGAARAVVELLDGYEYVVVSTS